MSRIVRRPVFALLSVAVVATALIQAGVFAEGNRDVRFSHFAATPVPDCLVPGSFAAEAATPVPPAGTPASLLDVDFRIEAVAANADTGEGGLPHQLRLYTVRLPVDKPLPDDIGQAECKIGYSIIYIAAGEVEFTHHTDDDGAAGLDAAGAVSYLASPATTTTMLPAGAPPVTLKAGDSIFLEQAIISFRPVGTTEALLIVSAVTPEWLPCNGGGCG